MLRLVYETLAEHFVRIVLFPKRAEHGYHR